MVYLPGSILPHLLEEPTITAALRLTIATSIFAGATLAQAQISSFDANDEGWTVTSFNNPNANDFGIMSTSGVTYNAAGAMAAATFQNSTLILATSTSSHQLNSWATGPAP